MDIKVYNLNEIQRLHESNKLNDKMLTLKLWQNKKYMFSSAGEDELVPYLLMTMCKL